MKLQDIIDNPKEYWLGEVVKIHGIGEYNFVEYKERAFHPRGNGEETGKTRFSIFINGKSINQIADTLEEAILLAIAYKYDECNYQAVYYFLKMIGSNPNKKYLDLI